MVRAQKPSSPTKESLGHGLRSKVSNALNKVLLMIENLDYLKDPKYGNCGIFLFMGINRIACLDLGHLSLLRKQLVGAGEAPGNEEDKAAFGSGSLNPKPQTQNPKP